MKPINTSRIAFLQSLTIILISLFIFSTAGCIFAPLPPTSTPTPLPTSTPTPTTTATSTPTTTATPDRTATTIARATETMKARLAELRPEFADLGYNTRKGSLVYDNDLPLLLTVDSYSSYLPAPIFTTPLKDFILHVDVKWDMSKSGGGCGIIFRAEDNLERGAQYMFLMDHFPRASEWGIVYRKFNRTQNYVVKMQAEKLIEYEPNSTNNIILVVKGDVIQAYINGKKLPEASSSKLSEGGIAFFTYQESGESMCIFKNAWIWEFPPT